MKRHLGLSALIFAVLAVSALPALHAQGGGHALNFFNADYLTHGDFAYLGSPDYGFANKLTVAAWVRWGMTPAYTIVGHESEGNRSSLVTMDSHLSRDNGQFWLQHSPANEKFEWAVQTAGGRGAVQSETSPVEGRWYFVVGVYDGDAEPRLKLYVNGVLEAGSNAGVSGAIAAHSAADRLAFGRLPSGYRLFTGALDEIRIWKSALTQADIRAQMCTATTQGTACASYWPLDAETGTSIVDLGPQGADGIYYSALVDVSAFDAASKSVSSEDKAWAQDGFAGMSMHTVAGDGVDEDNSIVGNTEHELTLSTWGKDPILDDYGTGSNGGMTWYGIRIPSQTSQWAVSSAPIASTGGNQTLEGASDIQGIFASNPCSYPSSILSIASSEFSDNDRVLFGHSGGALQPDYTNVPSGINHRLSRVWRMEVHTAELRSGNFVFDLSGMLVRSGSEGDLRLLVDDNGDFCDAQVIGGSYLVIDSSFIVKASLEDGLYYTIASTTSFNELPVELDLFTARRLGDDVVLDWRTVSERNNFGFYVQKSAGASPREWSDIGLVAGGGTANAPRSYRFVDVAETGPAWYRLRQVDRDGRTAFSDAVSVDAKGAARDMQLAMFPNPVRTDATVSFTLPEPGLVTATIINSLGSTVETLCKDRTLGAGTHWLPFDASALPGGMYVLHLQTAKETVSRPVFVAK